MLTFVCAHVSKKRGWGEMCVIRLLIAYLRIPVFCL